MEKILEVKKLKISFRTNNGTVKAVRDISFDLERGKTLAIVGESGSGKSVTSKAVMGILAGNSIIDGGEILYDGRDLLKITEEEMCKIRGDKIAMIFQDPLSSLNPIVKIGKQITEAMLLKNKASRKTSRKEFNEMLALLKFNMNAATDNKNTAKINEMIATFDKFCIEANRMENAYNQQEVFADSLLVDVEDFLFLTGKQQPVKEKTKLKEFASRLSEIREPFYTASYMQEITSMVHVLTNLSNSADGKECVPGKTTVEAIERLRDLLQSMKEQTAPNFFRIGYYKMKNPTAQLTDMPYEQLNQVALDYLNGNFMYEFIENETLGVRYAYEKSLELKKELLAKLAEAKDFYLGEYTKKDAYAYAKKLTAEVENSIDRMETIKDNVAYTFGTSLQSAINTYFTAVRRNPKEEKRFARQTAKREAMLAKGKKIDWQVEPMQVFDLDDLKEDIVSVISRLEAHYVKYIENSSNIDFRERAIGVIDYLKEKASAVVHRLTKAMAKQKAIKLMEEVGISDPRSRFYQYPFEFSGGMRQRIVIAIALAANPDILICDEPTTALDVTIQAQILELINNLKRSRNLSVIFITHDLGVVANMADDIAVMYAGKIVEYGTADDIFYDPKHPYTWALLSSMPDLDTKEKLDAIPGTPPNMIYPPKGDAFAARNKYAMEIDFEEQPPMFECSPTHKAATWLLHPDAPKVEMPKIITDRIQRMKSKNGGGTNG